MDDEGGDWFADAGAEPEPAPAKQEAPAAGEAAAPAAGGEAAPGAEAAAPAEDQRPVAEEYLDPDKLILFKHWIRPKFLQYNYLYNYRYNYYDDVIDYLDKRQRGLSRDIPRAQTWAERALRSYTSKKRREEYCLTSSDDLKLVTKSQLSGSFFRYHSRQYVNRRYSNIMY